MPGHPGKALKSTPPVHLIGVETELKPLLELLGSLGSPWLISLEGIGGIGKTALANALARDVALTGQFRDIAWVSAKQQDFLPATGLHQPTNQPSI